MKVFNMEIIDIIKEAFIFPSNNLEKLAIYIVLTFVMGMLVVGGIFSFVFSSQSSALLIVGLILCIAAIILALIISGYQLKIMKSGIDQDEEAPAFDWKNDGINGIKVIVLGIVYFIIPAIIVGIVALITNVPGNLVQIIQEYSTSINATAAVNSTASAMPAVSSASWAALGTSLAITAIIAFVLFIIFAFIQTMGQARLANTGSLGNGLNIVEAAKDISRIGVGKVIAVILLVFIVIMVIQGILGYIYGQIPQLSIISIIITPYFVFFTQRAYGLLYSDIA
ncbi:Protein of unknown function [Methanobrevibacter gottschalkii]|uniref:Uncharacterized protein DUF4013 n=3 Tax=Methanobacteriaceae TaxID=2159 RepID=A0A3N5B138_9EURY|nr:uncharacterized protein DUF4013 [Methanobrevibacter gottschalkii DSM 11977]SEK40774.1 Protein of unknown function [Methanobrevibacter gottschalkii]